MHFSEERSFFLPQLYDYWGENTHFCEKFPVGTLPAERLTFPSFQANNL
jgi:hypothetical protein